MVSFFELSPLTAIQKDKMSLRSLRLCGEITLRKG